MSWVYADYLSIRSDLVDVYSNEVDKTSPHRWQAFIPHKDMHELLSRLVRSLERQGDDHKKSLWIHGAYGTGKTFATFVVKHLLEDPLQDVERYLTRFDFTKNFWPRIRSIREKGPYLVIYRSSSAHIDSQIKLYAEIQEAIKNRLAEYNYKHGFEGACLDSVLEEITSPQSTFDWGKAFEMNKWELFPAFQTAIEVIESVKNGDLDTALKVAKVLEQNRVLRLNDPERMKQGIKEVIKKNDLQGIFYIWDEFTDFFINNLSLSGFQELAHATAEMPFYLLLVTHKSPERVYGDQESMNKVLERFHNIPFLMQPVTAYRLAGNALEVHPEKRDEWESKRETLWEDVKRMASHLFDQEANLQDFKSLVPLQPYSAFLLSTISGHFSSSQRTLFRFLKGDAQRGFSWFLRDYPTIDHWYWLTPDIIWDYFFGEEAEHTELTDKVRTIVNFFRSRSKELLDDPDAQRLFKAIMLFLALSKEMLGEERLNPRQHNLELAFQGTKVRGRMKELIELLQSKRCLNVLPLGAEDAEYTIPLQNIDERRLKDIRNKLDSSETFDENIRESNEFGRAVKNLFSVTDILAKRHIFRSISLEELKRRKENVQPDLKPYELGVVAISCLSESQLNMAEDLAAQCAQRSERVAYLVLQTPFEERRWDSWKNQLAHHCCPVDDT